jgi:hypothetical protein
MMYGNLPGDKYRSRDMELAQQLIAQSENNGTITSGLASILKKGMAGFLMGEDKRKADAYNKALTEGLATPYSPAVDFKAADPGVSEEEINLAPEEYEMTRPSTPEIQARAADGPMRGAQRNLRALLATGPNERAQSALLPLTMAQYGQDRAAQLAKTARENQLLDATTKFDRDKEIRQLERSLKLQDLLDVEQFKNTLNINRDIFKDTGRMPPSNGNQPNVPPATNNMVRRPPVSSNQTALPLGVKPGSPMAARYLKNDPKNVGLIEKAKKRAGKEVDLEFALPDSRQGMEAARVQEGTIRQAADSIYSELDKGTTGGVSGQLQSITGLKQVNPDQYELNTQMQVLRGALGIDALITAKKSGATFGSLTENEMDLLISLGGALKDMRDPELLRKTVKQAVTVYSKARKRAEKAFAEKYPNEPRPWERRTILESGEDVTLITDDEQGNKDFEALNPGDVFVYQGKRRTKGGF